MTIEVKTKRARKSNSFVSVIISWLGLLDAFQENGLNGTLRIHQYKIA